MKHIDKKVNINFLSNININIQITKDSNPSNITFSYLLSVISLIVSQYGSTLLPIIIYIIGMVAS